MSNIRLNWYLFLFYRIGIIYGVHFNGGTIRWMPVDPYSNSSSVTMTIIQSYWWMYASVTCTTDVPISTSSYANNNLNLICLGNCSNDGGYSTQPIDILTDCTSASSTLSMIMSERSKDITLIADAYFYLAYASNAWRLLNSPPVSQPWSIATLVNLRKRPDGYFNTPPFARVASPQYVVVNTSVQIPIDVSDVNKGDDVRCRWSQAPPAVPINECGGVCFPSSMPAGTTLSNCTLFFKGPIVGIWYAAAIQIEDFIDTTSTTPMGSITVQFLISVISTPTCPTAPIFIPLEGCPQVQVNVSMSVDISVLNLCQPNGIGMADVIATHSSIGMSLGTLQQSSSNASLYYKNLTWTPQSNQIGLQKLCVIAYTSEFVQSTEFCYSFLAVTFADLCSTTTTTTTTSSPTTSTSTTSSTTPTTTTTSSSTISTSTTSSTTATSTTTTTAQIRTNPSTNPPNRGPSWGLLAGIISAVLPLALCCTCCLYRLLWKSGARHHRQKENLNTGTTLKSSPSVTASIEVPPKSYAVYDIIPRQDSTNTNYSIPEGETSILVSMYNSEQASRANSMQSYGMSEPTRDGRNPWIRASTNEGLCKQIPNSHQPTLGSSPRIEMNNLNTTNHRSTNCSSMKDPIAPPFNLALSHGLGSRSNVRTATTSYMNLTTSSCDFNDWSRMYLVGHEQKN